MNAKEARKLSILNSTDDITDVLSRIAEQAGKGEFETWYYKKLSLNQIEALTKLGYKLSQEVFDRDGYLIKIEW